MYEQVSLRTVFEEINGLLDSIEIMLYPILRENKTTVSQPDGKFVVRATVEALRDRLYNLRDKINL